MDLINWLKREQIKQSEFAKEIGTDQATISRICRKKRTAPRKIASLIVIRTDGDVTLDDLFYPKNNDGNGNES